jgi:hypothetical protein
VPDILKLPPHNAAGFLRHLFVESNSQVDAVFLFLEALFAFCNFLQEG